MISQSLLTADPDRLLEHYKAELTNLKTNGAIYPWDVRR